MASLRSTFNAVRKPNVIDTTTYLYQRKRRLAATIYLMSTIHFILITVMVTMFVAFVRANIVLQMQDSGVIRKTLQFSIHSFL